MRTMLCNFHYTKASPTPFTHTHTHARMHMHKHTRAHAHAHVAHTHTHTHALFDLFHRLEINVNKSAEFAMQGCHYVHLHNFTKCMYIGLVCGSQSLHIHCYA